LPFVPAIFPYLGSVFFLSPGSPGVHGTKIFYTTAENKSKEEIGLDSLFYFFFTLFVELDLEDERETVDREGEERVTRALDVLLTEREEEELLDGETRLGEYDLELGEEDLILEEDRLRAESDEELRLVVDL
jgi:hypothetical protein